MLDTINDNTSFLSKDLHISIDENVSIGDIKLIPQEIKEPTDLLTHELQKENLNKNIKGNKYTQLLRKSNFDRNSVNININITSNEQSKYYQKVNKILNENLYSDKILPRGRKPGGLDVSSVVGEKDYKDFLMKQDNANLNLSSENGLDSSFINVKTISESVMNLKEM